MNSKLKKAAKKKQHTKQSYLDKGHVGREISRRETVLWSSQGKGGPAMGPLEIRSETGNERFPSGKPIEVSSSIFPLILAWSASVVLFSYPSRTNFHSFFNHAFICFNPTCFVFFSSLSSFTTKTLFVFLFPPDSFSSTKFLVNPLLPFPSIPLPILPRNAGPAACEPQRG